jgi:hypothetical protein
MKDDRDKIILHLCADVGSDSKPYRDAGYNVLRIGKKYGVENFHPSVPIYGIIANPVCTEFSVAQGFHKSKDWVKGLFLVNECLRVIREAQYLGPLQFYVIENPASGKLKEFLGPPKATYEPWHYGSPWTKKTALWGQFNMPERSYKNWEDVPKIEGLYTRPGRPKPGLAFMHKSHKNLIREWDCFEVEDDMSFRSLCSQKFAQAFFEANR